MDKIKEVFYGEMKCQGEKGGKKSGEKCQNGAYFVVGGKTPTYLCGVHSKKYKDRIKLKKNPNAKKIRDDMFKKHMDIVYTAQKKQRK